MNTIVVKDSKTYDVLTFVVERAYSLGYSDGSEGRFHGIHDEILKELEMEVNEKFGIIFKPNKR